MKAPAPMRPPEALRARLLAAAARAPGTRPGTWRRRVILLFVLQAVWLAGAIVLLGIRRDWSELPPGPATATLVVLTGVAFLASIAGLARGRAMGGAATEALSASTLGLLLVLHALVLGLHPAGPSTVQLSGLETTVRETLKCFTLVFGAAVPLLAFGLMVPRGLTLTRPILAGASLGLGAATFAHAVVWLHCPVGGSMHAIGGHLLPAIPLMALGALALWLTNRRSSTGEDTGRGAGA